MKTSNKGSNKDSNKDSNKEKKKMSFYRKRANNVIITVKFFYWWVY